MSVPLERPIIDLDVATGAYYIYLKNYSYEEIVKRYAELLALFELNLKQFSLTELRSATCPEDLKGFQGKFILPTVKDKLSKERRVLLDYKLSYDKLHYYIAELEIILDRISTIFNSGN
jgi:hypothetical protein